MRDADVHGSSVGCVHENVREHGVGQREHARHDPHGGGDAERTLRQRHLVDSHRVDDGAETVGTESGQREHGDAQRERLKELVQLAHDRAEAPLG